MFSASKTGAVSGGFQIANSLRFRSSASAYLNRTPSVAGNRQTWTWSGWVKRGSLSTGDHHRLFSVRDLGPSNQFWLRFNTDNTLEVSGRTSTVSDFLITTTQVFRDPSSWYHIVAVFDTTQATAANRVKVYVNGTQITAFSTATYPNQNYNGWINYTQPTSIASSIATEYFDGYLSEVNFIDGQALTPSSFGEIDVVTGVWKPKRYSGTYGTNGFRLNFSNGTSTTTLGYDSSGNSNNWTTNNISLTAGSTYDWMLDSPTPFAGSSYGVGNYAVLNPLQKGSALTLSNANLTVVDSGSSSFCVASSFAINSGKWYWEVTLGASTSYVGMTTTLAANTSISYLGAISGQFMYNPGDKNACFIDGAGYSYSTGATATTNDVIGVAIDFDSNTVVMYKNGSSMGTFGSSFIVGRTWAPAFKSNVNVGATFNFGQRPFAYTPPSGFKSLCTQNLPNVSIYNGAQYMAATLYTGNGSTQSIANTVNGVSFQPDLVWGKLRTTSSYHRLSDSVRGASSTLATNVTDAEVAGNGLVSFDAAGFTMNSSTNINQVYPYVAWQWKAGGTAVTNTTGSITSQVSANTTAGFSVVTYTSPASGSATVGHGLGVAPSFIVTQPRNTSGYTWPVYHISLGGATNYLRLQNDNAVSSSSTIWNGTDPTSTVFSIGSAFAGSYNMVAYCFAAIAGYSAFGSYTGNGSSDGPFVFLGFRPRFLLVKRTDAASYPWVIFDTARSTYNVITSELYPNASSAEANSSNDFDIVSNGFKCRISAAAYNASGGTYIYAAFAENPLNVSLAR